MIAIYEALGAKQAKIHFTYRYLINKNIQFLTYKEEMAGKISQRIHSSTPEIIIL